MNFKMLDEFIEQKATGQKAAEEVSRKVSQADEEYQALKAKYEAVLKESVMSDKDKTKELDQLSNKIEDAKKACSRRREERDIFNSSRPFEQIKAQDIVDAWNSEFIPAFKAEKMDGVLADLLKAKKAYADAVLAYFAVVDEFEDERRVLRSELSDTYYYRLNDAKLTREAEHQRYFLFDRDLDALGRKEMPVSIKEGK
jgi:chromosome segregation ATPase